MNMIAKRINRFPARALLLSLTCLALSPAFTQAQVIPLPNTLVGTVRFSNSNPAILNLLNAPGNEGMSNLVILASSVPPAPLISAYSDNLQADSRTSSGYQLTVQSSSNGIAYAVSPVVILEGQLYSYYFNTVTSAPVIFGTPPPALDFDECVGVVTIQFVASGGGSVAVDGGQIIAYDSVTGQYTGIRSDIPSGVTQQRIYLRGGATHRLDITVHRGTNSYTDRIESFLSTNVLATCDQFTDVAMTLPDSGSLGTITGNVDMLREFENTISGNTSLHYPDYTSVIANFGPYGNQRWGALPGINFTVPSSGPYTLSNVVPTTIDPLFGPGYQVYAQMAFRTNRMIELFVTPALGSGANAAVAVTPGSSQDLGNTFVIDPGYERGRLFLQGPSETPGHPSQFRGMLHSGDNDEDHDGIPDAFGTYGVYWSAVEAVGVDQLATGASHTASGGVGEADFDGAFNPVTEAFEGQYELALGGLNSERSLWQAKYLALTLQNVTVTNDNDYYDNIFVITDQRTNSVEVVPQQPVTNNIGYCFSEVRIVFRSPSDAFYAPAVRSSAGAFIGTDFQGQPANYTVDLEAMYGTPATSVTSSNIGQLTMYLPQGTYTLYPQITPSNQIYAVTGLEPLDLTVGCGQQIALEPCLQLSLDAPSCANTRSVTISGSVRSCTNNVASITYSLNGGPPQTICSGCGINPSFGFNLVLTAPECVDNTLKVTATDTLGGTSSVTTSIHYDATPPVIQCPADIVAGSCDTNGAIVNFSVTATDNCSGPLTIVSTPPSGSLFPLGTTTVNCIASDACGNSSACAFHVTVGGSQLSIQLAVAVTWTCSGTLQEADSPLGPWTDIPGAVSPYFVIATAAHKYYRVRQ